MTDQALPSERPPTEPLPEAVPGPTARGLDRRLVTIGGAGGVLSGLLGVGGGVIMVPLLVLWAGYRQRDAHAMSLGAIVPISLAGAITFGAAGKVRVGDAIALAAGSIVGARVGAGYLSRIGERPLKIVFGLFLGAVSILLLVR
ncbi:MAG: uncharacterized protein QOE36_3289 [Gaiellaceae bacterium]|nr:uncharacterized protein [Actinomycetota bacterium]MDX6513785.1 uncharacterized protein [Gaiellaceae bacterium]